VKVTAGDVFRGIGRRLLYPVNRLLHHLDVRPLRSAIQDRQLPTPVLIVGPPRSGSTLLYQLLVNAFAFSYFSNLHHLFYGGPAACEKFFGVHRKLRTIRYKSAYGQTPGLTSPSECGEFWYRFFPREPAYQPPDQTPAVQIQRLGASLTRFALATGKPVLIKNLYCVLRIDQILAAFPGACFISVNRDVHPNAASILECRRKIYGSYDHWFSVPPPCIAQLRQKSPSEQVIGQIQSIKNMIRQAPIPTGQLIEVSYEEVCSNPRKVIDDLAHFLTERDISAHRRETSLPEQFEIGQTTVADQQLDKQLRAALEQLPNETEDTDHHD